MTLAFRPALFPQDVDLLAEIFVRAITELGADYLDDDETAAWGLPRRRRRGVHRAAAIGVDADRQPRRHARRLHRLKDNAVIDMLYVSPDMAGMGVGTALVKAVETLAAHRGAKSLSVDTSDMAEALFRKLGYAAQRRNSVDVAGVWLASTTMTKSLAKDDRDTSGRH